VWRSPQASLESFWLIWLISAMLNKLLDAAPPLMFGVVVKKKLR
jgi:hypothetical protein